VKKANEAGRGEFAIQVRGGPEAIGMMEQPGAVRSGVVDMVYTPCAFYAAVVPECDAVSASTVDGPTARKNGGTELLNEIHQKRMGVVLLGWVDSGVRFCLWSTKEPRFDASGQLDIKGFKVRGNRSTTPSSPTTSGPRSSTSIPPTCTRRSSAARSTSRPGPRSG